jgi:1,4-alpha-glucan branching enzyme
VGRLTPPCRPTKRHSNATIDILHQSNTNRLIAFKRWIDDEEIIVVASFNDTAFTNGYVIERDVVGIPNVGWKEIFNSDGAAYGGWNVGNRGAVVGSSGGRLDVVVPAAGFVVFARQ